MLDNWYTVMNTLCVQKLRLAEPLCSEPEGVFMVHDRRKADHIRINLEENVQFPNVTNGFERYRLVHQALPELDLTAVNTQADLLGKRLQLPLLISSMTGGTETASAINRNLAQGAQARGIAMGLGSQRTALEQPETQDT
jgi:isopentenyl-diphosphate Delta-isomerase